MYKIIFFIALLTGAGHLQAQKQFINDPNAEMRDMDGSFTAIKISGGIEVYISQGNTYALAVSASRDEYKGAIKTEIKNGELQISYDRIGRWHNAKNKELRVYVSAKEIFKIQASSASSVFIVGKMEVPMFTVNLSGASTLAGTIKTENMAVDLSGASDAKLAGYAKEVRIGVSGASDMLSYNLETETCRIAASGASDVKITVTKAIDVSASGASDITYKGSAVLQNVQSSGASSVTKKE